MRFVNVLIPLLGIVISASVPLVRYAMRDRDERAAIEVMRRVSEAQRVFHARAGGYAADIESLTSTCDASSPALRSDILARLNESGYVLELRAAAGVAARGTDCNGRLLTRDYYLAAVPQSADVPGRQAFAARGDGRLFLFHDGIAPRETDFETGLPTMVEERETFKIP